MTVIYIHNNSLHCKRSKRIHGLVLVIMVKYNGDKSSQSSLCKHVGLQGGYQVKGAIGSECFIPKRNGFVCECVRVCVVFLWFFMFLCLRP